MTLGEDELLPFLALLPLAASPRLSPDVPELEHRTPSGRRPPEPIPPRNQYRLTTYGYVRHRAYARIDRSEAPGMGGARPPVTWAVERMTHRGGWETVATWEDGPPEPKTPYSVRPPSKIRCVRRRRGRIDKDGVEWTVEHPDAAERYERLRLLDEIRGGSRRSSTTTRRPSSI